MGKFLQAIAALLFFPYGFIFAWWIKRRQRARWVSINEDITDKRFGDVRFWGTIKLRFWPYLLQFLSFINLFAFIRWIFTSE